MPTIPCGNPAQAVAAATLAATTILGGCSASFTIGDQTLDADKVAAAVQSDLQSRVGDAAKLDVTCPEDVAIKAGATTECTATVGSQTASYKVTLTDDAGGFSFQPIEAIIDLDKAQTTIAGQLAAKTAGKIAGSWSLTCDPADGERLYVVAVEETFECAAKATDSNGTRTTKDIVVTVDDTDGNVTWQVSQ
jgi:hypothetical protein